MRLREQQIIDGKWKVIKLYGQSGQGQSAKVKLVNGDNTTYVLKALKNIQSDESIKRFKQEIELLGKLHHIKRIPQIVETDIKQHYYVMDYIEGKTLQEVKQGENKKGSFDEIMSAMMQLLNIVMDYSKCRIVHRDIKPGNIICKNGHIDDLYLVDFGMAYNQKNGQDLTSTDEHLGNRFLDLPELKSGNQRDLRSDLTQCVGILFYLLTGFNPTVLVNAEQKMPHQTERGIMNLQWVGSRNLSILNNVFDKGFRINIEERFQTVSDLIFALNEINRQVTFEQHLNCMKKTDSYC